jgi:hypothetical protein
VTNKAYKIAYVGKAVGTGITDSYWMTVDAVGKNNSKSEYSIANEFIACEVGRFLRLPIPPGALIREARSEAIWYASLNFNVEGEELPFVDANYCVKELPDLSTGLLVFDTFIANTDRHRGNLTLDKSLQPPTMSIFDHSHTLFGGRVGVEVELGKPRLESLRENLVISGNFDTKGVARGNRHCLLDWISTSAYFDKWIERIESIPDFFIEEVCVEAIGLGIDETESCAVRDFLVYRREQLRDIIKRNEGEFRSIRQWELR